MQHASAVPDALIKAFSEAGSRCEMVWREARAEDDFKRLQPYLEEVLLPALDVGRSLLVVAHGNSLRSLIMRIRGLSEEEVIGLELPTGVPLRFERIEGAWSTPSAMGG